MSGQSSGIYFRYITSLFKKANGETNQFCECFLASPQFPRLSKAYFPFDKKGEPK